jgi:hypothetical protein
MLIEPSKRVGSSTRAFEQRVLVACLVSKNEHSSDLDVLQGLMLLEDAERNEKTGRKRRWWTHPTLSHRLSVGNFHTSFNNHRIYPEKFFQYYRMSVTSFDELLGLIGENIVKQDTIMRQSIYPAERLAICLR